MTDETKPKRIRGQKDREAAYRAGFLDGLAHATEERQGEQAMERRRTEAAEKGLAKLRADPPVRRTRRKKLGGIALEPGSEAALGIWAPEGRP